MTKTIATPSRTKEILETYGLSANKNYGQNFLVDPMLIQRCVEEANANDAVIEIGPGIGGLTEILAKSAKHVTAIEVDEKLVNVLNELFKDINNVEIIHEDILKVDIDELVSSLKEKYGNVVVCANLPYYITSQILFTLFDNPDISTITVMVQKEVGERFVAKPSDSEYSALSVEAQYLYDVKTLFKVPSRSFNPSPEVDSLIIQFNRKDIEVDKEEVKKFNEFVRGCFKQRRKTIYNNLREYLGDDVLVQQVFDRTDISPKKRAQELSVEEIHQLYEASQ